ncbi:flagellar assembly peptidoglycan hydrolase FlgJ [Massilia sp. IC2-477]|uniref:flagellar assembly peptidoglycan hydrolase FlgJ n=1 Tax=unclassified Massilia TaxID=2609279 RepID=UPI001D0FFD18|nr:MULTISPECIES: flagellar assembly peptidoglycan hydrolase FlgJ [unclassified Massilia]MCC2957017.1 flagellar assembly peptidoglycan hydrolase FlgJ [Massilia sp. IC2-477]MCC2970826.1 flagellar assembly peptidoglycan hydrolase FlgJ [Massilia sp. IC2-476]
MIGSPSTDLTSKFALDTKGLGELKQGAKNGSPAALKEAATQFEAMFINMMMKSMRDATPQEGLMDNQQSKMFTGMLDQQMSQNLAKRGMGLADVLTRQLTSNQVGAQALAIGADGVAAGKAAAAASALAPLDGSMRPGMDAATMLKTGATQPGAPALPYTTDSGRIQAPHVRAFQEKLHVHAAAAERATGVPAKFMLGQAALESGWGKRMIRNADGTSSNNLFGIKAGPGWKGKVATAVTTEYVNGVARQKVERFRAYDTPADSFKDYANMLARNPRYEKVLASGGDATAFAHGLQRAGYATDPMYAAKLTRIIKNSLA